MRSNLWLAKVAILVAAIVNAMPTSGRSDDPDKLNARVIELYEAGEYGKAIPLAKKLVAICEKALGPDHPSTAASLEGLADLYRKTGREAEAVKIEARAKKIWATAK